LAVVFTTACVALCAPSAPAQVDGWRRWENGVTEAWWVSGEDFTEATAGAAVARWNAIGGGASGHAWAGDYRRGGSTHGTYLRWSPQGGFVIAHVNKCAAQAVGVVHGRAEFTPTLVRFVPEFSGGASSPHAHGREHHAAPPPAELRFVPVEWDGERLLIPEGEMDDFGDFLAGLGKYNDWDVFLFLDYTAFYTRVDDGRETGDGDGARDFHGGAQPIVPPGYERFLKRPIEATVTAVGRSRDVRDYTDQSPTGTRTFARARLIPVTVNVGTDHGAAAGMRFRVLEPSEGDVVKIVRAGKQTSEAVVVRSLDERGRATFDDPATGQERPSPKVRAGWELTTSLFRPARP
jgi:hypothetical protein